MATAFDSIGMGQLGSERRFMTQSNPLSEGLKGLKDFAILSAIDKSGLAEYLNEVGKKSEDLKDKYKTVPVGSVEPTQPYNIKPMLGISPSAYTDPYAQMNAQPPALQSSPFGGSFFNSATQQQNKSIEDAADEAMGLSKSTSFIAPAENIGSNQQIAESVLTRASQPAPPPNQMNMPQYGKKQGEGMNPLTVLATIAKFFI